jgi:hypothetical protein
MSCKHFGKKMSVLAHLSPTHHFGTEHFGKSHFGTDVSSQEHFDTCTLRPCGRSDRWTSQHGNVFDIWTFWQVEFMTPGIFGTMDITAWNISAPKHFGTNGAYSEIFP